MPISTTQFSQNRNFFSSIVSQFPGQYYSYFTNSVRGCDKTGGKWDETRAPPGIVQILCKFKLYILVRVMTVNLPG